MGISVTNPARLPFAAATSDGEKFTYIYNPDGTLVEQVRYSATGVPFNIPLGDVNADGKVETASGSDPDYFDINDMIGYPAKYHVRGDLDIDGDVDIADRAIAQARDGTVTGRGYLTMIGADHRVSTNASELSRALSDLSYTVESGYTLHVILGLTIENAARLAGSVVPSIIWPFAPHHDCDHPGFRYDPITGTCRAVTIPWLCARDAASYDDCYMRSVLRSLPARRIV